MLVREQQSFSKFLSNQQQNGGHVGGHFGSHFGGQFIKKRQKPFLTRPCKYVTHVSIKYILCLPSSGLST